MNNWKKYTLAAIILTVAGLAYINSSHRDIPSDLRDAVTDETSAGEFNLQGVKAVDIKSTSKVPVPVPAKPVNHEKSEPAAASSYIFDGDVPAELKTQIRNDLAFLQSIKGASASDFHEKIFGKVAGSDYIRFFESRVRTIGMDSCGNPAAVACVLIDSDPPKMCLTRNYIKFRHPQIARMMIVFHETRHTEASNVHWRHVKCPPLFLDDNGNKILSIWTGGGLGGLGACDRTPFGSYGSSMIMLKNIQKFCSNCTDKVRMDAGIYADDQFKRIIDPIAVKKIRDDLYR